MAQQRSLESISRQTLQRMPHYHYHLKLLQEEGQEMVSARVIAQALSLNEVQVRKDLAAISRHGGRPRMGFSVTALIDDIESFLGYDRQNRALLIGAGKLGKALLEYGGFADYGLEIAAAADVSPDLVGTSISGKPILAPEQVADYCRENHIAIGIITVPRSQAQAACDLLVQAGIRAIWNFAAVHLTIPEHVILQDVNIAASLAVLASQLNNRLDEDGRSPIDQ